MNLLIDKMVTFTYSYTSGPENFEDDTMDEFNMNTLFSDVLRSFDTPYYLEYAWLGGAGCEFSFKLSN